MSSRALPSSRAVALALCISFSGLGQIAQDHPELCGHEERIVPVPTNLSATITPSNGVAIITLPINGLAHSAELPGAQSEIREVCPIPGNRFIIFGWYGAVYSITIIDQTDGAIIDSFEAYDPAVSPDQNWLIMRRFYARRAEVTISDEYLLYDLSRSADANRHGLIPRTMSVPGRVIYPVVPQNAPLDPSDVPDSMEHRFRSRRFHWAPDSKSLIFADDVQDTLSLVLVTLTNGKIHAYVHPVSKSGVCIEAVDSANTSDLTLVRAEISPAQVGGPVVRAEFEFDSRPRCTPKQLMLRFDDFQPAKTEVYKPRPRKQAVPASPR